MPPLVQSVSPGTPMDQTAAGNPGNGRGDPSQMVIGKLRDLVSQVQDLMTQAPAASQDLQQALRSLTNAIKTHAQAGPQQTPSAGQVPGS